MLKILIAKINNIFLKLKILIYSFNIYNNSFNIHNYYTFNIHKKIKFL